MSIDTVQSWKSEVKEFEEKTAAFCAGDVSKSDYKAFSGKFGSYAQRSGKDSMLRLRMTAGCITKEHLKFIVSEIKKYKINRVHFTTCQTIQLHDLVPSEVASIIEEALDVGIVTLGGGGDYPRNVMCSPLSGVEKDECFDVKPYAEKAAEYLLTFINKKKMPRKLKVCFSNTAKNLPHATYRDLGFVAREDGKFDVYSAGGLGNNPKFGVKVADGIEPKNVLYYIKAMWLTFISYGNYESRAKARTRYMQDSLGGAEQYVSAFNEKLTEVFNSEEDLTVTVFDKPITKTGDCVLTDNRRIIQQKQKGLYTVKWHPIGGQPLPQDICALYETVKDMENVEIRLAPDETAYIINLTGSEAERVLEVTVNGAENDFEESVSCIGAGICQIGLRDSQALLQKCVERTRQENIASGALPQIHISGCLSSCGTHQTGVIGFRGSVKVIDKKPHSTFVLYVNGCEFQGKETMGRELGMILEEKIPDFLVELGKTVADSGKDFNTWNSDNSNGIEQIAEKYLLK